MAPTCVRPTRKSSIRKGIDVGLAQQSCTISATAEEDKNLIIAKMKNTSVPVSYDTDRGTGAPYPVLVETWL